VIAERGFARPEGLAALRAQGADFPVRLGVRLGRRSVALRDLEGRAIGLDRLLQEAGPDGPDRWLDRWVQVTRQGAPPLIVRLLARPLPPHCAAQNRRKLRRAGQQEGYTPSQAPSQAGFVVAGCIVLLTSLPQEEIAAAAAVALCRLRWQVELAIKRMKSLGRLDDLPVNSGNLAKAWRHANLIATLLTENLAAEVLGSPPSEPGGGAAGHLDLAPDRCDPAASARPHPRRHQPGNPPCARPGR
jgi:hypothetical protein